MKCQETQKTNQPESHYQQLLLPGIPPVKPINPYAVQTEVMQMSAIIAALSLLSSLVPLWQLLDAGVPSNLGTRETKALTQSASWEMENLIRSMLDQLKMLRSTSKVYASTLKMVAFTIPLDVFVLLNEAGLT